MDGNENRNVEKISKYVRSFGVFGISQPARTWKLKLFDINERKKKSNNTKYKRRNEIEGKTL